MGRLLYYDRALLLELQTEVQTGTKDCGARKRSERESVARVAAITLVLGPRCRGQTPILCAYRVQISGDPDTPNRHGVDGPVTGDRR